MHPFGVSIYRAALDRLAGSSLLPSVMRRNSAPKLPVAETTDPLPRLATVGRGILWTHILLTPLLFTQATIEHFEFVKFLFLITTILALLAIGVLALPNLQWDDIRTELRNPITLAGGVFVASAMLSTIASADWRTSLYGHYENYSGFVTILAYWLLLIAARTLIRTPRHIQQSLLAVVVAAVLVTAYGLVQAAGLDPLVWANPSKIGEYVRPFSSFGHANFLAAWLVLALPMVIVAATSRTRWVIAILALSMALLLLLTMSRGAWLGIAGAASVALILRWRKGTRVRKRVLQSAAVIAVGVLAITAFAGESIRSTMGGRIHGFLDGAGRTDIWSAALKMFAERPVLGTGPDTFHHHFGKHGGAAFWVHSWGYTPTRAHNEFLHVLATQGVFGLLALLGMIGAIIWTLRRAWRLQPDQRALIVAIAAALGGFAISETFSFTVIACGSLTAVLCAMASRLAQDPQAVLTMRPALPPIMPWRFAQAGLAAGCGLLFVQLVADPLRADLHSSAAALTKSPSEAFRCHREAVRICPRSPLYWNRFGGFVEERARHETDRTRREQDYRLAQSAFARAVECEPGNGYHRAGLGRANAELAKLGKVDPQDAFAAFDAAIHCDPSVAHFYVDASQAALQLGDAARAAEYVRAGLERYDSYAVMRKQAAMLHLLRNRPLEALPEFDRAVAADWKGQLDELQTTLEIRAEVIRRLGRMR